MEEVVKKNTELTKCSKDFNKRAGSSGEQSYWSRRNDYNSRPDYNFSRLKKSKWERFGEIIGQNQGDRSLIQA
jgi:hypothetical protein